MAITPEFCGTTNQRSLAMESDKCKVCGRRLYTEKSRRIGIGPVCLKKTMTKIEVAQLLARFTDIEKTKEVS